MHRMIVITVRGDHKYSIKSEKKVNQILEEINQSDVFYLFHENCAIRVHDIVSVEYFEIKEEKKCS